MNARRNLERMLCAAALLGFSACTTDPPREDPPPPPPLDGDGGSSTVDDSSVPMSDAGAPTGGDAGELWCDIWGVCTGADADGDGYDDRVDCDDTDPDVHPDREGGEGPWGAPTCCDGIDNDCNGNIDAGEDGRQDGCCTIWAPCMAEV